MFPRCKRIHHTKNYENNYRRLCEENFKQKKTIEEKKRVIEDKDRELKVADKKFKEREDALQRKVKKYKMQYEGVNKGFYESKREVQAKDEKISGLKKEVEFHKSEKKEMEKSHKSKMKEMEKKLSTVKHELETEQGRVGGLKSKIRRMSKQIVNEHNRWRYLGASEEAGEKMYHFESPRPDVETEPTAFDPGTEFTKIYIIPGKLNLSALKETIVKEGDVYAYIKDKKNNLSFDMPYQLYMFIREFLGKFVEEKYSGVDLHTFTEPLRLSLLELREKKEPEIESNIKTIEKFGRLNAGRELSIKEIADKCGISTVEAGMPLSRLCQRGVCQRVRRGCYVFEKAADFKDEP